MRSRNRSVKLPNALMDAGERRAEALGYGSFNAYIAALIREPPPTPGLRREGSRGDEKGNS
jgi:hypothetical protein